MEQDKDAHKYSALVNNIRHQFNRYHEEGYSAMFACTNPWGTPSMSYVPVPKGAWPWGILDSSIELRHDPMLTPIMAFDLKREFDAQMPEHMRQMDVFECLWINPLINIPDRKGVNPATERAAFEKRALKPERPSHLRLVK